MHGVSTPHARGSTLLVSWLQGHQHVYPACAGIHPPSAVRVCRLMGLPRMRGDPPRSRHPQASRRLSTPHARGSTSNKEATLVAKEVYPACAGIHPPTNPYISMVSSLPRMRGDPPPYSNCPSIASWSTPHARGSTLQETSLRKLSGVYPACAGIHLSGVQLMSGVQRLPRMRGDPPQDCSKTIIRSRSTPHARGSTARL